MSKSVQRSSFLWISSGSSVSRSSHANHSHFSHVIRLASKSESNLILRNENYADMELIDCTWSLKVEKIWAFHQNPFKFAQKWANSDDRKPEAEFHSLAKSTQRALVFHAGIRKRIPNSNAVYTSRQCNGSHEFRFSRNSVSYHAWDSQHDLFELHSESTEFAAIRQTQNQNLMRYEIKFLHFRKLQKWGDQCDVIYRIWQNS